MDTLMLGITMVSLVVAAAAAAVAWRVTRAERQRSAARVAALAIAAGIDTARAQPATEPEADAWPAAPSGLEEFPAAPMFGAPVTDSGSGSRQHGLLAAAAVAFVLVGGGSLVMLVSGRSADAPATAAGVPLELVALTHARTDGQLSVSGLVRNPATAAGVEQLEAHVRVFDAAGIMIVTRSAPVDMPAVAPGQDAPFTVVVGEATTAARYRVSFASRGTMLAHIDRRTNLPAAVTADAR